MFRPRPYEDTMIDPERGYTWRAVGTTQRGEVDIAVLTMNDREIPHEYRVDIQHDVPTRWFDVTMGNFGWSVAGQIQKGLIPANFASDAERDNAFVIALEAILAWHPGGLALERGDGYNRTTYRGTQYRLSDFGPYFENISTDG